MVNGEKSIRGVYGEKAREGSSKKYDMKTSKIKVLRREFFNIVLSDRFHADRAPASFMNAISRFRVTFFGYFNLHEDVVIIEEGDNVGLNQKALKAGAVGFLQKPFNGQELVDLIDKTY